MRLFAADEWRIGIKSEDENALQGVCCTTMLDLLLEPALARSAVESIDIFDFAFF